MNRCGFFIPLWALIVAGILALGYVMEDHKDHSYVSQKP
jgi:hypothetical protein